VTKERNKTLAEVAQERADLHREIEAMQTHQAKQEGRVELNIGGYRFQTSVDTLRRVPHTFFDAYFSGRYAQDVCDDGSIFVDRDGENFGHIF
jgi:type VI protein secretion system component VasK